MLDVEHDHSGLMFTYAGRSVAGFIAVGHEAKITDGRHAQSRGSGVFARLGSVSGILTCAHVAEAILREHTIGVLRFPIRPDRFQGLRIATDKISYHIWKSHKWGAARPDIAFLRLPDTFFAEIMANASYVDLLKQVSLAQKPEPADSKKFDLVSGIVDEFTAAPEVTGTHSKTTFTSLHHVGRFMRQRMIENYDICRFRSMPGAEFKAPQSYRGMSGGPMWRFYFRPDGPPGERFIERRLMGIAFFEFRNGPLVGHTLLTLYPQFVRQIAERWA